MCILLDKDECPFSSKLKRSYTPWCQGMMYRAILEGILQDLEPGLIWSLPAGKGRQSWYADLVPDY